MIPRWIRFRQVSLRNHRPRAPAPFKDARSCYTSTSQTTRSLYRVGRPSSKQPTRTIRKSCERDCTAKPILQVLTKTLKNQRSTCSAHSIRRTWSTLTCTSWAPSTTSICHWSKTRGSTTRTICWSCRTRTNFQWLSATEWVFWSIGRFYILINYYFQRVCHFAYILNPLNRFWIIARLVQNHM